MTFINSGYGANNYSNSLSSQGLSGTTSASNTQPSAKATESFNKSMQGSGQSAAGDMDISKLIALIEQFLKSFKAGDTKDGGQAEGSQGGGSSGSNGAGCGCDGKKTGSSSKNEGSTGGADSLGDKEGNGGGTVSNTDKSRKGDETGKSADKSSHKGKY